MRYAILAALLAACSKAAMVAEGDASAPAADAGVDAYYPDPDVLGPDPVNGQDAGCPLRFVGPLTGTTASSVARDTAGVAWSSPEKALTPDGQLATVSLDVGASSEWLRITGYGFTIPSAATVKGVYVELSRQASTETGIADGTIALWLDGAPSTRPKNVATAWPHSIVGVHHYGQATDTWGDDLTPDLVDGASFGVQLWAQRLDDGTTGPNDAMVESIRMSIFYCD